VKLVWITAGSWLFVSDGPVRFDSDQIGKPCVIQPAAPSEQPLLEPLGLRGSCGQPPRGPLLSGRTSQGELEAVERPGQGIVLTARARACCARQSATRRRRGAECANMRALRAGSSFISDFPALASCEGFFLETVARSGFELYRVYTCGQTACGALLLFKHHRQRPEPGFGDRERVSAPMLPLIRGCHASIPDLRRHE
jgi:hypothetical protein